LLLLHLVGFFNITLPTLMMHGQTQIRFPFIISDNLPEQKRVQRLHNVFP